MHCPYCGSELPEGTQICAKCGAAVGAQSVEFVTPQMDDSVYYGEIPTYSEVEAYPQNDYIPITVPSHATAPGHARKQRRKPHILLRIPLQLLSLVLSIVLTVSLLATALLLDLNRMLSAGGIKQIVNALFSVSQTKVPGPLAGALGMGAHLDNAEPTQPQETLPGDLGDLEIPTDVLTSGDTEALVEWMMQVIQESTGAESNITKEQLQEFVENSTISEYVAEKAAGYAEDFINGTQNTLITSEELVQLMEDNKELISKTFQVEITDDMKAELQTVLQQTIEENRINEVIHEEVIASVQEALSESLPVEWEQIQAILQMLTSDTVMLGAVGVCLVLMLLLCVLNFYNIPGGLTWSSLSCLFSGALLSAPILLLQSSPDLMTDIVALPAAASQLILSFLGAMSLVHYGIFAVGVFLLVVSIIWRAIRAGIRNASPAF